MSSESSRTARVLRAIELLGRFEPWHLRLPIDKPGLLWWEVLSPYKVRLPKGGNSLYFVTYERGGRRDTLLTLYKADGWASEFSVALKERIDLNPNDFSQTLRHQLLVAVDQVANRITLVYLRRRPVVDVGEQRVVLRHSALHQGGRTTGAYESSTLPVPADAPIHGRESHLLLRDVLFCDEGLLLSALFIIRKSAHTGSFHKVFYLLKTRDPKRLDIELLGSDSHEFSLYTNSHESDSHESEHEFFLSHFTYKRKFIQADGAVQTRMELLPIVIEPIVMSAKRAEACTILARELKVSSVQATLKQICRVQGSTGFTLLGEKRHWLIMLGSTIPNGVTMLVALRGWDVTNTHVLVVRKMQLRRAAIGWAEETLSKLEETGEDLIARPIASLRGDTVLMQMEMVKQKQVYLARLKLDAWLPKPPRCFGCRRTKPLRLPLKIQACRICMARGFDGYPWLFGSRFCGADCLETAWPTHRPLHDLPPLDHWTLADWKRWRHGFKPDLDSL